MYRQGSSISSPALTAALVSESAALPGLQHGGAPLPFIAHQSVRTKPWKPNSVRSMSVSSTLLAVDLFDSMTLPDALVTLMALYAAITEAAPPSSTIIS